jgi:hypothetical protein
MGARLACAVSCQKDGKRRRRACPAHCEGIDAPRILFAPMTHALSFNATAKMKRLLAFFALQCSDKPDIGPVEDEDQSVTTVTDGRHV